MSDETDTITDDDLAALNQRALLRVVDLGRRASAALLLLAGVLALAWVWQLLRTQGVISDDDGDLSPYLFAGEDLEITARVDLLSTTITSLGLAGVVAGLGIGVRVYCEATAARVGGSLTGWSVGDAIEPPPDDDVVGLDPR